MSRGFGYVLVGGAMFLGCGSRQAPPAGYAGPSAREFVVQHRPELEREIGVGSGENLYQLSILAGCQDLPALGRELRNEREEIFGNGGVEDAAVADRVLQVMTDHPELRCVDLELSPNREFAAGRRKVIGASQPGESPRQVR
jgi:DUF3015 family protein